MEVQDMDDTARAKRQQERDDAQEALDAAQRELIDVQTRHAAELAAALQRRQDAMDHPAMVDGYVENS
jgi:hypothetical protein